MIEVTRCVRDNDWSIWENAVETLFRNERLSMCTPSTNAYNVEDAAWLWTSESGKKRDYKRITKLDK